MNKQQQRRELALYCYHNAMERGDFETVAALLREAEGDPVLARMVVKLNAALETEMRAEFQADHRPLFFKRRQTASLNGRSRATKTTIKESDDMTIYETAATAPLTRFPRRVWGYSITLIAAVVAVILFTVLLAGSPGFMLGSAGPEGPDQGAPGAALQAATPTIPAPPPTSSPIASPLMPTVLASPLMSSPIAAPLSLTATPFFMPLPGVVDFAIAPPPFLLGQTVYSTLPASGAVVFYAYTAERDGAVVFRLVSPNFEPRLLLFILDDPELGIERNVEDNAAPMVTVTLNEGDRVLLFIYSADGEQGGAFLISLEAVE